MEPLNPYQSPQEPSPAVPATPPRFRWRIIPATLCLIFGPLGFVVAVVMAIDTTIQISRHSGEIDIAPLYSNRIMALAGILAYAALTFAGIFWLRGKWILAVVATLLCIIVMNAVPYWFGIEMP
jgi:hypothetical protein